MPAPVPPSMPQAATPNSCAMAVGASPIWPTAGLSPQHSRSLCGQHHVTAVRLYNHWHCTAEGVCPLICDAISFVDTMSHIHHRSQLSIASSQADAHMQCLKHWYQPTSTSPCANNVLSCHHPVHATHPHGTRHTMQACISGAQS